MDELEFASAGPAASRYIGKIGGYGAQYATHVVRLFATVLIPIIAFALLALAPTSAKASNVQFVGSVGYTYAGNLAVLTANEVANLDSAGFSGTLHLELWAFPAAYTGAGEIGYKLSEYSLGQLVAGFHYSNISSGSIAFAPPPNGTWIFTMFVTEYTGVAVNGGYTVRDWVNFSAPVVFGPPPPPPPPPPALTPQIGLWWNPNESGSGYAFDYKHGVLVVTVYSYLPNGTPQWYLASGSLSGSTFTSTLDKYVAGQCIACAAYPGRPSNTGNDGAVTIIFSSPTSATMYLPGGRVTQIQPQAF
jgi:hypothetical protein